MEIRERFDFRSILGENSFTTKLVEESEELLPFISRFSNSDNVLAQVEEKSNAYSSATRTVLCQALHNQGNDIDLLNRLKKDNCFTITTGHQLNLLTGPLYSIYKIASAIKTTESLKKQFPNFDFVPVFWMATEDHDFEEINHINLFGDKIEWQTNQKGAVGRFGLDGIEDFLNQVEAKFRELPEFIESLLECYKNSDNLAEAHRKLVWKLFDKKQLIILDGDDALLKSLFRESIKKELEGVSFQSVTATNDKLESSGFKSQAFAREINLFYLSNQSRVRIEKNENGFSTIDKVKQWTKSEIETEIDKKPENFSPNVLMRPLYQESILPNLMYIGGGGELAYWIQLKKSFEAFEIPMPMIQLRFSALIAPEKQLKKWNELGFSNMDLFKKESELIDLYYQNNKEEFDIISESENLMDSFSKIIEKSEKIDKNINGFLMGERKKLEKQLDSIEKKVRKQQKQKMDVQLNQISKIKSQLFPNNNLQERELNVLRFVSLEDQFVKKLSSLISVSDDKMNLIFG